MAAEGGIFKRSFDYLSHILGRRHEKQPEVIEKEEFCGEVVSTEGCLRVVICENKNLEFYSTVNTNRLFSIRGAVIGPIGKFSSNSEGEGTEIRLTVPVRLLDGTTVTIKASFSASCANADKVCNTKLVRAGLGTHPDGEQIVNVLFVREQDEFQMTFELESCIKVENFNEVVDNRPVFQNIPSPDQMSTFLRAVTSHRRNVFKILENLKYVSAARLGVMVDKFLEAKENGLTVDNSMAVELKDLFERTGRSISEQVIAAFAIFIEMAVGHLVERDFLPQEGSRPPVVGIAPAALFIVSKHFGLPLTENLWNSLSCSRRVSWDKINALVSGPIYEEIPERLKSEWDNRTPLSILEQLARDSGSRRVANFAEALHSEYGDYCLAINDQQMGLLALLSASGRRYHANTVAALCLFVDADLGVIDSESISDSGEGGLRLETSAYAMVVVGGAFDLDLSGLELCFGENQDPLNSFASMADMTGAGLLADFRHNSGGRKEWLWVRNGKSARKAFKMADKTFTNVILGAFPKIGQISEVDLADLMESGRDFVASFQSDLDKTVVWRPISSIPEDSYMDDCEEGERRRNFSFIDGFCAYHFSCSVIGRVVKIKDEELIGQEHVIAIYYDDREHSHYINIPAVNSLKDLEPPAGSGLVWGHQIVAEQDVSCVPRVMREMGSEVLLGRKHHRGTDKKYRRLEWLHDAVWTVLTVESNYQSLSARPDIFDRIHKKLSTPEERRLVSGIMDQRTLDIIEKVMSSDGKYNLDFSLNTNLLLGVGDEEQLELVALRILFEMSQSDLIEFEGYYKLVDVVGFRSLIHERIMNLVHSGDPIKQVVGCRMLATREEIYSVRARSTVQYELKNILNATDNDEVGTAACEGLLRICMADKLPVPEMIQLTALSDEIEDSHETLYRIADINKDEIKMVEKDVDAWLRELQKESPEEFAALPIVDASGDIDRPRLASFTELIAALNQSCRNSSGHLPRRYFSIVSERQLEEARMSVLECWKLLAAAQGTTLLDMVSSAMPAELMLDYRFFIAEHGEEISRSLGKAPYFGGASSPLRIYHFRPDEPVGTRRIGASHSFSSNSYENSEFFADLLSRYFESSDDHQIRILKIKSASGVEMEKIESHLSVFDTTRIVDTRSAEVFVANRVCFLPLLHDMDFTIEEVGGTGEDIDGLHAVVMLLTGRKFVPAGRKSDSGSFEAVPAVRDFKSASAALHASGSGVEAAAKEVKTAKTEEGCETPDSAGDEQDSYSSISVESILGTDKAEPEETAASEEDIRFWELNKMAEHAREAVELPSELQRQVLNVFILAARKSLM